MSCQCRKCGHSAGNFYRPTRPIPFNIILKHRILWLLSPYCTLSLVLWPNPDLDPDWHFLGSPFWIRIYWSNPHNSLCKGLHEPSAATFITKPKSYEQYLCRLVKIPWWGILLCLSNMFLLCYYYYFILPLTSFRGSSKTAGQIFLKLSHMKDPVGC